jgi:DNA adenine methylase
VKYHPEALQKEVDFLLPSREDFNEYRKLEKADAGWTDIQRAARFYELIKFSYGAGRKSFGTRGFTPDHVTATLQQAHRRLSKVIIENKDFAELINLNDATETFFYCDPPYFEAEHYYNVVFTKEDHIRLRDSLSHIEGKFLLSYNDCDFIRELYRNFSIEKAERNHNFKMGSEEHIYAEVMIANYDMEERRRIRPKQYNLLDEMEEHY